MDARHLKSKPSQPDNAEFSVKCPECGNMVTAKTGICDVCGQNLKSSKVDTLYSSNEDY